jgi:hypothetical protein
MRWSGLVCDSRNPRAGPGRLHSVHCGDDLLPLRIGSNLDQYDAPPCAAARACDSGSGCSSVSRSLHPTAVPLTIRWYAVIGIVFIASAFSNDRGERIGAHAPASMSCIQMQAHCAGAAHDNEELLLQHHARGTTTLHSRCIMQMNSRWLLPTGTTGTWTALPVPRAGNTRLRLLKVARRKSHKQPSHAPVIPNTLVQRQMRQVHSRRTSECPILTRIRLQWRHPSQKRRSIAT